MSSGLRAVLPLERLRGGGSFSSDARFSPLASPKVAEKDVEQAHPECDPVADAYGRGFADGYADAKARAAREEAERETRRSAIELAFARFDADSAEQLRERMRQTVHALCEATVLPVALDPESLAARIEIAAAMLQRAQDERRVLINPEDFELVEGWLPAGLTLVPAPSVERGALRIETADGGIEDGPSQWRRIIAEAFHEC